ncbi:unnamed protein product [Lymnaea stagnalis]|uniref:tRNA-uridine aminocarboxypropyltransferase 1 n=1 Tax=Lymnaea stagnalis TaxID=6523 RepID=A0AAV2HNM4_LYMST
MEPTPFPDLVIADFKCLDSPAPRTQCVKCGKSRKYYCYNCFLPLPHLHESLPKVKLPLKVDIIKHPNEIDGKSTAPHAAILAPDDVTIYTYPCIPDYESQDVVLVFPCEDSITLEDMAASFDKKSNAIITSTLSDSNGFTEQKWIENENKEGKATVILDKAPGESLLISDSVGGLSDAKEETTASLNFGVDNSVQSQPQKRSLWESSCLDEANPSEPPLKLIKSTGTHFLPFDRVVFVDSTWNQTHNIINDERLKNLKRVELRSRNTHFWRCQDGKPKTYLSTIEAIYYFIKDFHTIFINSEYNHEYDNLLFFFSFMYQKIRKNSGGNHLKAYQR